MLGEDKVFAALVMALRAWSVGVLGLSDEVFLSSAGVTSEALEDPDALVPYDALVSAWAELHERFPDRSLGMDYGRYVDPSALGMVGVTICHAPNVGVMVERLMRFQRMVDPHFQVDLQRGDDVSVLTMRHEPRVAALHEIMEMFVTSFVQILRKSTDRELVPVRVDLAHPRRHPVAQYEEVWGAPVRFEQPTQALWFDSSVLEAPVVSAAPEAGKYLERYLETLMPTLDPRAPDDASVSAKVREHLLRDLSSGDVDQPSVASALGMSSRSMQRKLSAEGTSFSALLDDVRRVQTERMLARRDLAFYEIAYLLGFADPSSFYRACKRWVDMTPDAWRASLT